MNYPKFYIENTNEPLVIWRADVGGVEVGMDDSPFESSSISEAELKMYDGTRCITKREAKSLFPNLIK